MQCQKLKTNLETGRVIFLPLRLIRPNPGQPRQIFEETALAELADSIEKYGLLQPISVRRIATGYELIAGERRLRAAALAGLSEVPCLVMQMDDRESEMAAMVENLQRRDLDFVEEARGLKRMMVQWGLSQEQIAATVGKSQSAVANKLRILQHSEGVLEALRRGGLTERHARALLQLRTEEEKMSVIEKIVKGELSVVQTENLIKQTYSKTSGAHNKLAVEEFVKSLSSHLRKFERSGIGVVTQRRENQSQIVLTITINKSPQETREL